MKNKFSIALTLAVILTMVITSLALADGTPSITSDLPDYGPGDTVTLTGAGWQAGEAIHIFVNDNAGSTWSYSADVTAAGDGTFTDSFQLPNWFVATYNVTATGGESGVATTTFTDGSLQFVETGLPLGTNWSVTWNGSTQSSTTTTIAFGGQAATGNYTVGSVTGYTASPASGSASRPQNSNTQVNITFTVSCTPPSVTTNPADQSITYGANASFTVAGTNYTSAQWQVSTDGGTTWSDISGANSSTYSLTQPAVSMSGNKYHAVLTGDCGSPAVSSAATLTVAKANQTITFPAIADRTYGDADFDPGATASSGLPVSYSASGNCTIISGNVHITGAGSCTVTASQPGNDNYNAALDVSQSFNIAKANQTITFGALADKTYGDADFAVNASASSGLAVSFSASGNCTISGSTAHITGAGSCTITASQGGDANYKSATDVSQSFSIAKAPVTATAGSGSNTYDGAAHSPSACLITGAYTGDLTCTNSPASVGPNAGTTTIEPNVSGTGLDNFDITYVNGSYTINKADAKCSVTPYHVTYDGTAHTATGSCVGVLDETLSGLDLSGTTHTDANTYSDSWQFTDSTGNYKDIASTPITDVIDKAPVTATAGSGSNTYDGATHSPSACAVTGDYIGDLTCANDPASVGPDANTYEIAPVVRGTGLTNFDITYVKGSYTINKADAKCTITGYSVYYDGFAHSATGSCLGVLNETLSGLDLSKTSHIVVGSWSDPWTFTDVTGNYKDTSGTVSDAILAWTLKGFYQPVDLNGVWNTVKGGSTVPFKFNIFAGPTELTSVSVVKGFTAAPISCPTNGYLADAIDVLATGGTSLRYDSTSHQFIYNWQTPKKPGSCYQITMTTLDGSTLSANFMLK